MSEFKRYSSGKALLFMMEISKAYQAGLRGERLAALKALREDAIMCLDPEDIRHYSGVRKALQIARRSFTNFERLTGQKDPLFGIQSDLEERD